MSTFWGSLSTQIATNGGALTHAGTFQYSALVPENPPSSLSYIAYEIVVGSPPATGTVKEYDSLEAEAVVRALQNYRSTFALRPVLSLTTGSSENRTKLVFPGLFTTLDHWCQEFEAQTVQEAENTLFSIFRQIAQVVRDQVIGNLQSFPAGHLRNSLGVTNDNKVVIIAAPTLCNLNFSPTMGDLVQMVRGHLDQCLRRNYIRITGNLNAFQQCAAHRLLNSFCHFHDSFYSQWILSASNQTPLVQKELHLFAICHPATFDNESKLRFFMNMGRLAEDSQLVQNTHFGSNIAREYPHPQGQQNKAKPPFWRIKAEQHAVLKAISNHQPNWKYGLPGGLPLFCFNAIKHYWEHAYKRHSRALTKIEVIDLLCSCFPRLMETLYCSYAIAIYRLAQGVSNYTHPTSISAEMILTKWV